VCSVCSEYTFCRDFGCSVCSVRYVRLSVLSVLSVLCPWSGINVLWSPDMLVSVQICSVVARNDKKPLFHTQNTNSIMFLDVLSVLSVLSSLSVLLMFSDMFCGLLICSVVPEMTRNLYFIPKISI
jgi:hypothetical protein